MILLTQTKGSELRFAGKAHEDWVLGALQGDQACGLGALQPGQACGLGALQGGQACGLGLLWKRLEVRRNPEL